MLPMKKMSDALVGSRILVIDDSLSFQRLTEVVLNSFGVASVTLARNLTEGMHKMNFLGPDKFSIPKIDIILLDINLPDGNGIEACEYLSGYASSYDIPVVVVSGNSHPTTITEAFDAGASDYLQKPLTRSLLGVRLGMLMSLKSASSNRQKTGSSEAREVGYHAPEIVNFR
jgi:CheY-like chemotaxis protein